MGKWLKTAFLAAPLIAAGYLFGVICQEITGAYELILFPSRELLNLAAGFLLALAAVAVAAGPVAALVRPVWVGMIAFALSGLAMLLGWEVSVASGFLVFVYLLAASVYAMGVARELNERIRFSLHAISQGQGMLLMALVLVACGSLYIGSAADIEREGFSIPRPFVEPFVEQMEKRIEAQVPEGERQEAVTKFREEFWRAVDEFSERTLKPYERFIPVVIAVGLFSSLVTITRLLVWIPTALLGVIFRLLTSLGVTRVVTETMEVQRLVLD